MIRPIEDLKLAESKARPLIILFLLALVSLLVSLSLGRYPVPIAQVFQILLSQLSPGEGQWTSQGRAMVLYVRLPRVLAGFLIGGALSGAGAVYQGIFRNPMVSPDVLGSSSGAAFGAALGIYWGLGSFGISLLAFVLGLTAVLTAVFISSRPRGKQAILGLVLAGIMIGSLFNAGTSFIKLCADTDDQLPAITYWLMGSLASVKQRDLIFLTPLICIGLAPLLLLSWKINLLTMDHEEAQAMGINVQALLLIVIFCAALVTAASVAISGMIGWVGLVVPHLARKLVGSDYRTLLPASILLGGSFLLCVDNLARTLTTSEIPIGILTVFIGTPFFLSIILKNKY